MARIEAVRLEAGRRMGLGDVRDSVPKPVLLAPGAQPAGAALALFHATVLPSLACRDRRGGRGLRISHTGHGGAWLRRPGAGRWQRGVRIEHPSGAMDIEVELATTASRYGAPVWCAPRERS